LLRPFAFEVLQEKVDLADLALDQIELGFCPGCRRAMFT
jgi:hypothetical protein